jgi:hypothetical protein
MKLALFLIAALFIGNTYAQFPDRINKKMGEYPIFFLDSVEISSSILPQLNPLDISSIDIVTKKKAKKLLGKKGADGAVYIATVKFSKKCYWKFLCSVSDQYKQVFESPAADSTAQYELNGQLLTDQAAPGDLFLINKKTFKSLQIKDSPYTMLRRYVVIIKAKPPKGVIKLSSLKN